MISLIVMAALGLASAANIDDCDLKFDANGEFKILQLTDMHFGADHYSGIT